MALSGSLKKLYELISANLFIIFNNKLVYFILISLGVYLLSLGGYVFSDTPIYKQDIHDMLVLSGILFAFFPATYSIQQEQDNRSLELILTLPNSRFSVWLFRFVLLLSITFLFLYFLALPWGYFIDDYHSLWIAIHSLMPVLFLASIAFLLSVVIRNGNGAATVVIIVGLVMWILSGILPYHVSNIFLSPYDIPENIPWELWKSMLLKNRLLILSLSLFFCATSLLLLQKREKFLK